MAKVSIVVPVVGHAFFVDSICMSLFCQVEQDIQIVFACNGADNVILDFLKRYADFDERIGVASAFGLESPIEYCRLALEYVNAPYTVFLDGRKNFGLYQTYLLRLLDNIKKYKSDLVYTQNMTLIDQTFQLFPLNQLPPSSAAKINQLECFSVENIGAETLFELSFEPWFKLYKTSFLKKLSFSPYEETFGLEGFLKAKRISAILNPLCIYKITANDLWSTDVFEQQKSNQELLIQQGVYEKYKNAFICYKLRKIWQVWRFMPEDMKNQMYARMKQEFAREDFSQYDANVLNSCSFYGDTLKSFSMDFEQFKKVYR